MPTKLHLPEDEIVTMYVVEHKKARDIAKHFGCGKTKILNILHAHEVDVKPRRKTRILTDDWLRLKYQETTSINSLLKMIREEFGIKLSAESLRRRLRSLNLKKRKPLVVDENWLYGQYVLNGRSTPDIASELRCHHSQILRILRKNGWNRDRHDAWVLSQREQHEKKLSKLDPSLRAETSLAWVAGFIDGEGTITFKMGEKAKQPVLSATNSSEEAINKVAAILGGGVKYKSDPRKDSYLTMWRWDLFGWQEVREAVRLLLPYLVVKRKEAELALAFLDGHVPHTPYTKKDEERFQAWYEHVVASGGLRRRRVNIEERQI
jgi:transposase